MGRATWHRASDAAKLNLVSDAAFYSDRTGQPVARVGEEITENAWRGLVALISSRLGDGYLAHAFPIRDCVDTGYVCGTDDRLFMDSLRAHVPLAGDRPLLSSRVPDTTVALDILEFLASHIEKPTRRMPHDWAGHEHLLFSSNQEWIDPGAAEFANDVDLILARNGIAFTFGDDMRIRRLGPPEARQLISDFRPKTGDAELDAKLVDAVARFQSRTSADRQDALEKLWDAFERLKTLEPANDKKASIAKLLDQAVPQAALRNELDSEFRALTIVGNNFTIRHHERDRHEVPDDQARDYLFIRLTALIAFVLRRTGRMEQ